MLKHPNFLGKKLDEEGQNFCVLTINYQLARIFNFLIQKTFKLAGLFKGIIENTLTLFYILMKYLRSHRIRPINKNIFAMFCKVLHRLIQACWMFSTSTFRVGLLYIDLNCFDGCKSYKPTPRKPPDNAYDIIYTIKNH